MYQFIHQFHKHFFESSLWVPGPEIGAGMEWCLKHTRALCVEAEASGPRGQGHVYIAMPLRVCIVWGQGPGTSWNTALSSLDLSSNHCLSTEEKPALGSEPQRDFLRALPTLDIKILSTIVIVRMHMG